MEKIVIFLCSLVFGIIMSFINFKILKNNNSSNNNIFFYTGYITYIFKSIDQIFFSKIKNYGYW